MRGGVDVHVEIIAAHPDLAGEAELDDLAALAAAVGVGRGQGQHRRPGDAGRAAMDMGGGRRLDLAGIEVPADLAGARIDPDLDRAVAVRIAGPGHLLDAGQRHAEPGALHLRPARAAGQQSGHRGRAPNRLHARSPSSSTQRVSNVLAIA